MKNFFLALIGAGIGAIIYIHKDDISTITFVNKRYPIEVEFSILSSCAGNSPSAQRKDMCICALKETQKNSRYDNKDFALHFNKYMGECSYNNRKLLR